MILDDDQMCGYTPPSLGLPRWEVKIPETKKADFVFAKRDFPENSEVSVYKWTGAYHRKVIVPICGV